MNRKQRHVWTKNRDIARRPKLKGFWCDHCDMCLVRPGSKCKVCGARGGTKKRLKKDTNS